MFVCVCVCVCVCVEMFAQMERHTRHPKNCGCADPAYTTEALACNASVVYAG
jgi:hypothetical protein